MSAAGTAVTEIQLHFNVGAGRRFCIYRYRELDCAFAFITILNTRRDADARTTIAVGNVDID